MTGNWTWKTRYWEVFHHFLSHPISLAQMILDYFTLVFHLCHKNSSRYFPHADPSHVPSLILWLDLFHKPNVMNIPLSPFSPTAKMLLSSICLLFRSFLHPATSLSGASDVFHLPCTSMWGINHLYLDLSRVFLTGPSASRLTVFTVSSNLCLKV